MPEKSSQCQNYMGMTRSWWHQLVSEPVRKTGLDFTKAIERNVGAMETWLARNIEGEEDHLIRAVYTPTLRKP